MIVGPRKLVGAALYYAMRLDIDPRKFDCKITRKKFKPKFHGDLQYRDKHRYKIRLYDGCDELLTLAHEMVHIRQYEHEELLEYTEVGENYQGKFYPKETPYYELPWEWEALGRSMGLCEDWRAL